MFQGQPPFPPNLQFQQGYFPWPPVEPAKPEEPKKPEPTPFNTVVTNFLTTVGAIPPPPPPPAEEKKPADALVPHYACYPMSLPPPPPQQAVACHPPGPQQSYSPWAIYQPAPPEKPKPKSKKPQQQMQSRTAVQYQFRHGRAGGDLKAPEEQWGYGQMQWGQMGQMGVWEFEEEEVPAEDEQKPAPGYYWDGRGWWYQS